MGRMLIGAREGIKMMRVEREEEEEEGIMARKWLGEEVWNMIGVYVNKDLQKKLERMREWMEEREKGVRVIVGGDLNARTGTQGGWGSEEGGEEEETRRSKDKKINSEGRRLCQFLGELGWGIMNGDVTGDEEGEFTYTGNGESVTDYVLGNEETRVRTVRLVVEEKVESDHQPVVVWIEGGKGEDGKRWRRREEGRGKKGWWTEDRRKEFGEGFVGKEGREKEVEEVWGELRREVLQVLEKMEKKYNRKEGRDAWDEGWKKKKNIAEEELKKWKRERGSGESFRKAGGELGKMSREKKSREEERWEKEKDCQ
ncbi:golgin subfamily A member 6-like protein 24 [Hylaeus anthracinus]|uniref:golgin subfamily A member 6-like protein 24 n=1 Tax=Hylaeus anthracinus TaxID=313031 RepID=UPI0023BA3B3D|nr:golgin subfamily A member 6-like protein 24 [Hylaeus anthracinus]